MGVGATIVNHNLEENNYTKVMVFPNCNGIRQNIKKVKNGYQHKTFFETICYHMAPSIVMVLDQSSEGQQALGISVLLISEETGAHTFYKILSSL